MAPQGVVAPETCLIGIRAEVNAGEANSQHTSRISKHYLKQNLLLTKDELGQKRILEEVSRKHFSHAPLALPPCQLLHEIPCKKDPKRASVNLVFSCPIERRDFDRHAAQRGCNSRCSELALWSDLCPGLPVPEAARA